MDERTEKISLALAMSVVFGLTCLRAWFSTKTGFLLPDEGLYFHATIGNFYIRPLFTLALALFKKVLFINTLSQMLAVGPFFGCIFTCLSIVVFYKILKASYKEIDVRVYSLLSVLFLPVFTLLGVTWLTEAPSFFFVMVGIWMIIRHFIQGGDRYLIASLFALCVGSLLRESGWVFLAGMAVLLVYLKFFRKERVNSLLLIGFILLAVYFTPYLALETLRIPPTTIPSIFPHHFERLTEQNVPIFGIPPERHPIRFGKAVIDFLTGSVVAYGIIPFVLVIAGAITAIYDLWNKKSVCISTILSFSSLLGFLSFAMFCVRLSTFSPVYISTIIRFAYVSFPAALIMPKAYNILAPRFRKIVFSLTPILLTITMFIGLPMMQYGLSVASVRVYFDPNYVAPYFRACNCIEAQSSRVAVFAEPYVRISLFLSHNPNVTIYSFGINYTAGVNKTRNAAIFDRIIHYDYWDHVLVYGEFYQNYYVSLRENSPFFLELIRNGTSYDTEIIWWDEESYMLEVIVN